MTSPGWYSEPGDASLERYWDGGQWTPQTRAASQPVEPSYVGTHASELAVQEPAPRTARERWLVPGIAAATVLVLVGGFLIYWFAIRTPTMNIRGTMDLEGTPGDNYSVSAPDKIGDTSCVGTGGYSDIAEGASVIVTDGGDKTLGVGHLEAGIYLDGTNACIFGFEVDGVPADKSFYGVTVTHRGNVQFSKSEIKHGPDLSLGNP